MPAPRSIYLRGKRSAGAVFSQLAHQVIICNNLFKIFFKILVTYSIFLAIFFEQLCWVNDKAALTDWKTSCLSGLVFQVLIAV